MKKLVLGLALAFVANAAMAADPVKYLDWDSTTSNLVEKTCTAYDLVTADTVALSDGKWYVVDGNVVIDNGDNIKVNGSAHLILCDNASLTIKNVANSKAAIDVSVSGSTTNSLAIYGQQGGSGVLSATGGRFGAGIGGGFQQGAGGIVTIKGGVVTATGGERGAGIGGGNKGAGGTVTINGGEVAATGCNLGAGIGGGDSGAGGTVTVSGGIVTATGGNYGAGIGGGNKGAGGTVTINSGTVTATGGGDGAGIGGGFQGAGGTVTVNGGVVTAMGSGDGAGIGGGVNGDHGTVTFGVDAWLVLVGDFAPGSEVSVADYANNHNARYVCIKPSLSLKIPAGVHYSYVVSNETTGAVLTGVLVDGTNTYSVKNGSTVKVYFTLDEFYMWDGEFDNPKDLGVIEDDKVVDASEMPKAKGAPGSETNPWKVGENVTAYIKDRVLYLKGAGAMDDFASAEAVPWAAVAGDVTAVTVEDGVTKIGKNALAGFADTVTVNGTPLSTYRTVSLVETKINGMPLADYNAAVRRLNVGEEWKEASPASAAPVIPDDKVLVSKESIAAAKAMTVQIVNGQIELSVSVSTNADITAEVPWAPVKFTPDTQIGLSADGTKLILPISAAAQQGFMILQSGDAKAVPSNGAKQGFYKLEAR